MKTKRLLMAALLIVTLATGLYAQRDSLCMAEIDTWEPPEPADLDALMQRNILVKSNQIYIFGRHSLYVLNIEGAGSFALDTIIEFSGRVRTYTPFYQDTLVFVGCSTNTVLLNFANPARPVTVFTYSHTLYEPFFAKDTILYGGYATRYNISDIFAPVEIPTTIYATLEEEEFGFHWGIGKDFIDYPRFFGKYLFSERIPPTELLYLFIAEPTDAESLTVKVKIAEYPGILYELDPPISQIAVKDSFLFATFRNRVIRTYRFRSDRDTMDLIHTTDMFGVCAGALDMVLHEDSLLISTWCNSILVFNVSDPYNVRRIAYHNNNSEGNMGYSSMAVVDSFIVVKCRYGLKSFKFSSEESVSENASAIAPNQLQLEVYPNPFNSTCKIGFSLEGYEKPVLSIFNLQGRKVLDKSLELSQSSYLWDATGEASGVYIVALRQGDNTTTKRVMLLK